MEENQFSTSGCLSGVWLTLLSYFLSKSLELWLSQIGSIPQRGSPVMSWSYTFHCVDAFVSAVERTRKHCVTSGVRQLQA